jgi:hypothetical protein
MRRFFMGRLVSPKDGIDLRLIPFPKGLKPRESFGIEAN